MTKLLQNKAVVTSLCGIALLAIAANFKKPSRFAGMIVAARSSSASIPEPAVESFPVPPPLRSVEGLAGWREMFPLAALRRDPFAPALLPVKVEQGTNPAPSATSFTLQAVSIEPERRLAVLNQRVVAAGDSINGYRVESIHPSEVRLRGSMGAIIVNLRQTNGVSIDKSSLGKGASADQPSRQLLE